MYRLLAILALSVLLGACGATDDGASTSSAQTPAAEAAGEPAAAPAAEPVAAPAPAETEAADAAPAEAPTEPAEAPEPAPAEEPAAPATLSAEAATAPAPAPAPPATTEAIVPPPVDTGKWVAGKHYFVIEPQQARVTQSDKVEVVEVFSYGCPACSYAQPFMLRLAKSLPDYAVMDFLPASFLPTENWPLYQRAWYTADAFGVAYEAHDAMFDAIWKGDRPLGTFDEASGRPKPRDKWPQIEDVAKFYAQYGVDPAQFVATSKSFTVNTRMKRADQLMKSWMVGETPTIVIDGRYRITGRSAGTYDQMIELTLWLAQKERNAMQTAAARAAAD